MSNYFRIHHIRPRFKNNVESVLAFMANEISNIGEEDADLFKEKLNSAIRFYPGNASAKDKTINNWRTEISALFALLVQKEDFVRPSELAITLEKTGNLIEFFQSFLHRFQYPGGHLKPKEIAKMILAGIKFKPAHYILKLMVHGTTRLEGKRFGFSKTEATHLIFNNLSVTRDNVDVKIIYEEIIGHRSKGTEFDSSGDVVRYAGDILDYLVLADLVDHKLDNKYYPRMHNKDIIDKFISNTDYFEGYKSLYGLSDFSIELIKDVQADWQAYASELKSFGGSITFKSAVPEHVEVGHTGTPDEATQEKISTAITADIQQRLEQISNNTRTTLDIGNLGEAIAIQHEKNRITECGGGDQVHKIQKLPEKYSMGFDIKSLLGNGGDFSQIFIEVKSTLSRKKLTAYSFNLTTNEFDAAKTHRSLYFIYRIFMSETDLALFVIQDPVTKAFKEEIAFNLTKNGGQFKFDATAGAWKELLL